MKFWKKYKFLSRTTALSKHIFSNSKKLWLKTSDLDFIFKLLNFSHFWTINSNLQILSKKSWTSKRTFQNTIKKLKEKWYLQIIQKRHSNWLFSTNSYDLSWLFNAVKNVSDNKQLRINFAEEKPFWKLSSTLELGCATYVPKVLDCFQKSLNITSNENVFLKYLFWYIDNDWISEISLNYATKTTSFTRTLLSKMVKELSEKGLIIVKEQFFWTWKIRIRNRYDLKPLLDHLNELERKKVDILLKKKGKWLDYNSQNIKPKELVGLSQSLSNKNTNQKNIKINNQNESKIRFLENEIRRYQSNYFSKYSQTAEIVRTYQKELSELKYWNINNNKLNNLVLNRINNIRNSKTGNRTKISKENYIKAEYTCNKLWWNWNKSFNLYIKAVKKLPWTVDRFVWLALEKAKNKEKYFAKCVSKEFRKLELMEDYFLNN